MPVLRVSFEIDTERTAREITDEILAALEFWLKDVPAKRDDLLPLDGIALSLVEEDDDA